MTEVVLTLFIEIVHEVLGESHSSVLVLFAPLWVLVFHQLCVNQLCVLNGKRRRIVVELHDSLWAISGPTVSECRTCRGGPYPPSFEHRRTCSTYTSSSRDLRIPAHNHEDPHAHRLRKNTHPEPQPIRIWHLLPIHNRQPILQIPLPILSQLIPCMLLRNAQEESHRDCTPPSFGPYPSCSPKIRRYLGLYHSSSPPPTSPFLHSLRPQRGEQRDPRRAVQTPRAGQAMSSKWVPGVTELDP
ncbi:hypothetical protein FA13DRAFT_477268 [Coprinellus micaceus]|uniref:Uncharacterized protein n=1 Tax=Coprinellus micaceus TaxID=71717 RepID=A0A4Y7TA48_COPMI|nr:hypothetical protein FA13DRAFT_477268 [Coprinellus micaceus]